MIGALHGKVLSVDEGNIVLDVHGVGYEVSLTHQHLSRLSQGDEITLIIETLVAETFIRLVGFETTSERKIFRLLQTVQGVGSKAALAILNVLSPVALMDAVAMGDKTAVSRAQGVGPKLAQRIVTELKNKTGTILLSKDIGLSDPIQSRENSEAAGTSIRRDAVGALMGLGYDEATAQRAIQSVAKQDDETVESVITAALKGLSVT